MDLTADDKARLCQLMDRYGLWTVFPYRNHQDDVCVEMYGANVTGVGPTVRDAVDDAAACLAANRRAMVGYETEEDVRGDKDERR